MKSKIVFKVTIEYDNKENPATPIDSCSARDNLFNAIERERQNGALTPTDISANWIEIDHVTQPGK
ncbi:MAG: hypothetical protein GY829_08190 [Gammaproteobacteria bacterium]|nr:hypothetical protein [Gammaproteobacteria bacterium]